jgi:hypothetical protein
MPRLFPLPLATALSLAGAATLAAAGPEKSRPGLLLSPPPGAAAVLRTDAPGRAGAPGRDYADAPDVRGLRRWRRLPVRVYFDNGGAFSPARREAALDGFDEWAEATGGDIGWREVDDERDADVVVRFSPLPYLPPGRGTVGRTGVSVRRGYLNKARMELATGGVRSLPELTEVAAHEWGHALGIDGHSPDPDDLMYAVTTRVITNDPDYRAPVRRPTSRDVATIRRAYGDGAGPRRAPALLLRRPDAR